MKDYERKDLLLKLFADNIEPGSYVDVNIEPCCDLTGFDKHRIDVILSDMQKQGLLVYAGKNAHNTTHIQITEKLFEFLSVGGYSAKHQLMEIEFEKLQLEIKALEKKLSVQDLANLTSIASNIGSVIGLLYGK